MSYAKRNGFGTKMPRVSWEMLSEVAVKVPSEATQEKTAILLDSMDASLGYIRELVEQTKQTKSAAMQSLLLPSSKSRVKFRDRALGELFAERKESGNPGLPTLSVTMHDGIVDG
jgi:hypothetical protein